MWERRRQRRAVEAERRREFELAVGGLEELVRGITARLEEASGVKHEAMTKQLRSQASKWARGLCASWAALAPDDPEFAPPGEFVDRHVAELVSRLEGNPLLGWARRHE